MKTRILVILSLLVGIGAVLHAVAPPIIFGMKPDMLLAMMFLGIILFPQIKYVMLLSLVTGAVSALTTTFPMGQLANMIEKPITALVFLGLFLVVKNSVSGNIAAPVLTAIGTIVSGSLFISIGLFVLGAAIPGQGFITLFIGVVLPTVAFNTILMVVIYPVIQAIMKRSEPIPVS